MNILNLTKNEEVILNYLADSPVQSFFGMEIAKKNKLSAGGAHNALVKLKEKNFVSTEERGRMKFYKINSENILVKQYRAAYLLNKLSRFINDAKKISIEAILFGSGARGEYGKDSDIDIFILTNSKEEALELARAYQKKYAIKAIVKTPNEWQELEIKEPEFYGEIKRGIKL
ncbi:MAG: nucleotidyltransferase domain-containing protein [Patescibacteria group bacterium]|nr:nucleotidyltransferase domain-containing protein [Patescibacteria group bacterium]